MKLRQRTEEPSRMRENPICLLDSDGPFLLHIVPELLQIANECDRYDEDQNGESNLPEAEK